jgi:signal transduction histidine kinase
MPRKHSIESSRFEEFRNPSLGETLSAFIAELKVYLPTQYAAIFEKPATETGSYIRLAGEAPRKLRQIMTFDPHFRSNISPGQVLTIDSFTIFPVTVFHTVNHMLAIETPENESQAIIVARAGHFACRISAALEFRRVSHILLREESGILLAEKLSVIAHEMHHDMLHLDASIYLAIQELEAGRTLQASEELYNSSRRVRHCDELLRYLSRREISYRFVAVEEIVERSKSFFNSFPRLRRIEFACSVAIDISKHTVCLVTEQVLCALFLNSAEALATAETRDERPAITLKIAPSERAGYITASVIDNGPGIPLEVQDRIFKPGFSTKEAGHGMGLYVSRNLAESIGGGLILLRSEKGKGATFILTIPAKPLIGD